MSLISAIHNEFLLPLSKMGAKLSIGKQEGALILYNVLRGSVTGGFF
jgi:hypothetical protein